MTRRADLVLAKRTALQKANVQNVEEARPAQLLDGGPFFFVRFAGNFNFRRVGTVWGEAADFSGVGDTGQGFEAVAQWTKKSGQLIGGLIELFGQRNARHEDVIGLEPQVHLPEFLETAHQQASANHEHEGHGDFQDDHAVAEAGVSNATTAASFPESRNESLKSRREAPRAGMRPNRSAVTAAAQSVCGKRRIEKKVRPLKNLVRVKLAVKH